MTTCDPGKGSDSMEKDQTGKKRKGKAEDLTGRVFGRLTVVSRAENRGGRVCWNCRCSCGQEKVVRARDLKSGTVKSCGCLRKELSGKNKLDLSGKKFGRLTPLYPIENRDQKGSVYWRCRCECGNMAEVTAANLVYGLTKSCGCLQKENQKKIQERLHRIDGTCIEFLEKRKTRSDNKSGFRGVFQKQDGKYKVTIGFRGKRYSLGNFTTYEEAVERRLKAEQDLYGSYLKEYYQRFGRQEDRQIPQETKEMK